MLVFIFCLPPTGFVKRRVLRKKKRAGDKDVFTRFSFLNIFIIAQKKRKVKRAEGLSGKSGIFTLYFKDS